MFAFGTGRSRGPSAPGLLRGFFDRRFGFSSSRGGGIISGGSSSVCFGGSGLFGPRLALYECPKNLIESVNCPQ